MKTLGRSGSETLIHVLCAMTTETVKAYPILAGTVQHDPASHGMRMIAHMTGSADDAASSVFTVVHHAADQTTTYADAEAAHFAPAKFDLPALCRHPTKPSTHSTPQPIFAVQANFITGGIVIAFQLHHSIADGRTMGQIANFLKTLLVLQKPPPVPKLSFRLSALEDDVELGDPYEIVKDCEERVLDERVSTIPTETMNFGSSPDTIQALLMTPAAKIIELRDRANKALQDISEPAHVSKNDVLGAYVWSCVTAARFQDEQVDASKSSSCYIPVDWRKRVVLKIGEEFFGHACISARTSMSVKSLVDVATSFQQEGNVLPLAKIALAIRAAVGKVDTALVKRRLQLALSVEATNMQADYAKLAIKHVFAPNDDIDVMLGNVAPVFKFEDTTLEMMKPGFFRAVHNALNNGVIDVVPGTDSERMEMTMALSRDLLGKFLKVESWSAVVERTIY